MSALDDQTRLQLLSHLATLLRHAAQLALDVYSTQFAVEYKGEGDPVTVADRRINDWLVAELSRAYPAIPVVAEESPKESYAGYRDAPAAFFLDPIDGTSEYVQRTGQFCIMLGLVERGRPSAGVIAEPTAARLYLGALSDHGTPLRAERCEADGSVRPLALSVQALEQGLAVVSRSHYSEQTTQLLARLGVQQREPYGSAGLKAMRVACGSALLYAHAGYAGARWDAAAPEAICRAAGASYTDAQLQPYRYDQAELANARGVLALPARLLETVRARLTA